jgi:MtN3 and saliva related transmembrane protein
MELIEIVGLVAGTCTSSSLLPQLIKTVKTKEAQDVSVFMFIVMLTGNSLWTYYGIAKSDLPIILTNLLALGLNIAMLVLKYKYRHR